MHPLDKDKLQILYPSYTEFANVHIRVQISVDMFRQRCIHRNNAALCEDFRGPHEYGGVCREGHRLEMRRQ